MTSLNLMSLLLLGIPAIPNLFGIWHAFNRQFPTPQERLVWLGICVFVPVVGGCLYIMFGMRRARKIPPYRPEGGASGGPAAAPDDGGTAFKTAAAPGDEKTPSNAAVAPGDGKTDGQGQ